MKKQWLYFAGGVLVGAYVLKRLPVKIPGL
jgi:hypothetical protein